MWSIAIKYITREKAIELILNKWNNNKFKKLGLEWKVGWLGAWIEITHDVKDYGVYVDFAGNRGFTADSDAMASPSKWSNSATLKHYKDSWSASKAITPTLLITPKAIFTPENFNNNSTNRSNFKGNLKLKGKAMTDSSGSGDNSSRDDPVEYWDTYQLDSNEFRHNPNINEINGTNFGVNFKKKDKETTINFNKNINNRNKGSKK